MKSARHLPELNRTLCQTRGMEFDGRPVTAEELLPLATANFGHFTSMRVEADGTVRGFGLHLERLVRDCQATFGVPLDPEIARGFVRQFVGRNPGPLALRVTVYDPTLTVGAVGQSASPHFLVTANPATEMPSSPLRLKTFPFTRDAAEIKHTGLWSQLHRRRQAKLAGFDDALFVEPDRSVSEGATWTVGFIDADNRVVWPDAPTLPSTTQQLLDQACDARTTVVKLDDLPHLRAAFAANVSIGARPISQIDDVSFPPDHPALRALREAYAATPGEVI